MASDCDGGADYSVYRDVRGVVHYMANEYEKTRFVIDFTKEAMKDMHMLTYKISSDSNINTIGYALRALKWIVEQLEKGRNIQAVDSSHKYEPEWPFVVRKD